jgi:hypothetical protein
MDLELDLDPEPEIWILEICGLLDFWTPGCGFLDMKASWSI